MKSYHRLRSFELLNFEVKVIVIKHGLRRWMERNDYGFFFLFLKARGWVNFKSKILISYFLFGLEWRVK